MRHVFLRHSAPPVLVVINIEMTQRRFILFLSLKFLQTKLGQPSKHRLLDCPVSGG